MINKDYSFIKRFQEIKISRICKDKKIDLSNLLNGSTTDENYKRVKDELIRELLMLIIENRQEDLITLGLYDEIIMKQQKEIKALKEML